MPSGEFMTNLFVLVAAALALISGSAQCDDVQYRVLPNGLEVLVQEDHSAPLVSSYIWYRVGLRNEREGEAGLSHFLEHIAFKGTERFSGREMDRLITQRGGYLNGFTSMDYTAYVETLPRDALDLAFEIESQRMSRCLLAADDVESEKGVVLSEFARAENDPSFLLRRRMMAAQFPGQPYGRMVIGEKDDLRALTRETVASYYRRHYAPNNAVLVVVGDIEAEEVFGKAEQFFGSIPGGEPVEAVPNRGRGATGEQRERLELPGRTSYLHAVYEVPPIDHADHVALEVLQSILSVGRTSRMYQALVDTGLAATAGGWQYESSDPTVFAFEISLRPGVEHAAVEEAFDSVIARVKQEAVGERELTKARNLTKANFIYATDGVSKRAQQLGYYHVVNHYRYLEEFPAKVEGVTAEDVARVARTYFARENRTVGWLVASGEGGGAAGAGPPLDIHRGRWAREVGEGAETGSAVPVPPGLGSVPKLHELRLPNGLQVILQENHAAPFVSLHGNLMAGPAFDPPAKAGLATFCAEALSRGTQKRTWQEIREALEFVAADLGFGTGAQVATVNGRCMSGDLSLLLATCFEQLTQPAFPPEEIEKVRSEMLAAQERRDEDTYRVAEKELLARLYPEGHPLHEPALGTKDTVASITPEDLRNFHLRYYRPENTILAIVGDFDAAAVAALIERTFSQWESAGEPARPELPAAPLPEGTAVVPVPVAGKTQADIALGFPGISRRDPDYYPSDLMSYLLGRGFMSRLNMRIREDMGMAYYVWCNYYAYWGPGPWILHMGIDPANVDRAISAAVEELEKIQREAPSQEELDLWKDYVEGTVARRMETFSGIAQNLVLSAFYELGLYFPYEYPRMLREITAEQVQQAARTHLHPQAYIAVAAGPVGEN